MNKVELAADNGHDSQEDQKMVRKTIWTNVQGMMSYGNRKNGHLPG